MMLCFLLAVTFFVVLPIVKSHQHHGWLPKYPAIQALQRRGGSTASEQTVNGTQPKYSIYSVAGKRLYMEDEYFVSPDGTFAGVFDGHGGKAVSRYIRQNLYANYQAVLPNILAMNNLAADDGDSSAVQSISAPALQSALSKVDQEVQEIVHWSFQGSTACVCVIEKNSSDGSKTIVTANLGDSRAVLSRNGIAIDLTKDHKPNDNSERKRIEALGGSVDWCGELDAQGEPLEETGVYRINGNLALSRAVGDRSERPYVSSAVDISCNIVDEEQDAFVVIATDGLYDVMTSQEVVSFIHDTLELSTLEEREMIREHMAKYVGEAALARGSLDNITVVVLWINSKR